MTFIATSSLPISRSFAVSLFVAFAAATAAVAPVNRSRCDNAEALSVFHVNHRYVYNTVHVHAEYSNDSFLVCLCTAHTLARERFLSTYNQNEMRFDTGQGWSSFANYSANAVSVSVIAFALCSPLFTFEKPIGNPAKLIACIVCSNGRNVSATIRNYNLNCKHVDVYFIIDSIAARQWTMNLGELECTAAVATMAAAETKKMLEKSKPVFVNCCMTLAGCGSLCPHAINAQIHTHMQQRPLLLWLLLLIDVNILYCLTEHKYLIFHSPSLSNLSEQCYYLLWRSFNGLMFVRTAYAARTNTHTHTQTLK